MYENIWKLLKLIQEKYEFNAKNEEIVCNGEKRKIWNTSEMYIKQIEKEIEEMKKELKVDNSICLEDELWDILWDFLNLAYILKREGLIESEENIFKRCEKKFSERIEWIKSGKTWEEVKKKQKEEFRKENLEKYGYTENEITELYNKIAKDYKDEIERNNAYRDIHYKYLEKYITHGKILDVGCWYGRDIKYFLSKWFDIEWIDISPEMKSQAEQEIQKHIVIDTFYNIESLYKKESFSALWSMASLVHIDKKSIENIFQSFYNLLKKDWLLFLSIKKKTPWENEDYKVKSSISTPNTIKKYTYFSEEEINILLEKIWFTKLESYTTQISEHQDQWLNIIAKK